MNNWDELYTVDAVAEILSVTPRTVRNYLKDGTLKGRKVGGQWRFTKEDVLVLINGSDIQKEIAQGCFETVMQFNNQAAVDKDDRVQVCTIVDVNISKEAVGDMVQKLCTLFSDDFGTKGYFRFVYMEAQGKARFVLGADTDVIRQAMDILSE